MANRRTAKIVVHMEPLIFNAAKKVIENEGLSDSAYARKAIIADLMNRGLLTAEMVASLSV